MKRRVNCPHFSLSETLECGQCFRFHKEENGGYTVIASSNVNTFEQEGDSILFYDDGNVAFWTEYFDWERDYQAMQNKLALDDDVMHEAISFATGIHIVKQAFFETLLSFIISQNNHIPRIRGLIQKLSETYGTPLGGVHYAFPTAAQLTNVTEADYRQLGCGFRGRYLEDAVRRVLAGGYRDEELSQLPTEALRERLMDICGVGQKVADCVMLFSLGRYEVFPTDVWIQRIMREAYFQGEVVSPKVIQAEALRRFGQDAGFAQQYLFHYGRAKKIGKGDKG